MLQRHVRVGHAPRGRRERDQRRVRGEDERVARRGDDVPVPRAVVEHGDLAPDRERRGEGGAVAARGDRVYGAGDGPEGADDVGLEHARGVFVGCV